MYPSALLGRPSPPSAPDDAPLPTSTTTRMAPTRTTNARGLAAQGTFLGAARRGRSMHDVLKWQGASAGIWRLKRRLLGILVFRLAFVWPSPGRGATKMPSPRHFSKNNAFEWPSSAKSNFRPLNQSASSKFKSTQPMFVCHHHVLKAATGCVVVCAKHKPPRRLQKQSAWTW